MTGSFCIPIHSTGSFENVRELRFLRWEVIMKHTDEFLLYQK